MPLAYTLSDNVSIIPQDGDLVASGPNTQLKMPNLSPAVRDAVLALATRCCTETEVDTSIIDRDGVEALSSFYYCLCQLGSQQMLRLIAAAPDDHSNPLAVLEPISPHFTHHRVHINPQREYRLSRFAYLRRCDGQINIESPLSHARVSLIAPKAAVLTQALAQGGRPNELAQRACVSERECEAFLELLAAGGFADAVDDSGALPEECDTTLMQWDFHDLLFHARSRMGRHNNPVGGRFRFLGHLAPQPAVKAGRSWSWVQPLPRPDLDVVRMMDPSLETVMEARASVRQIQAPPVTIEELGEFLFRVARVKSRYSVEDKGEFTTRPYPSGGASYELELYLTVDRCAGLTQGFYWYDPVNHALCFLHGPDENTLAMLLDAHVATARLAWPQILISLAARFQRVSWKYDAMAYATILKNTGVLYAVMYLVGTAMGLAPCGIGLGNSDRFARTAGTNYYEETSVGEFILSGKTGRGRMPRA